MHRFANPTRFLRLANALLPWLTAAAVLLLASGLWLGLLRSPADYQQGETVRIMYVHVPAAWMAMAGYTTLALSSLAFLVWKHPLADLSARAASPIGAGFTAIALVTGALWGQPMWGTWWVWDARLTSVLVLLFLYLGHMALTNAFDDPERGGRAGAVLALVGVVNLPIIKFSVDWWNTLHQPASVLRLGGSTIDPAMMKPLFLMAGGYLAVFGIALILRIRALYAERRLRQLRLSLTDA
ncbi:heme ABC transporter permease [Thalassobaculum sp.]|uniref:heme ABC transporter permease n=1 Tax=Thalassobaculum sp. TaxID=2022740 RepID=UPI0032ED6288